MGKVGSRPRVLVIGARGFAADASVAWTDSIPNAADFDAVVIVPPPAEGINANKSSEVRAQLATLLDSGGELCVIASADETWQEPVGQGYAGHYVMTSYSWSPIQVELHQEDGETKKDVDPRYKWYFNRVTRWSYIVSHPKYDKGLLADRHQPHAVILETRPLAKSRYGKALATEVRYHLFLPKVPSGYVSRITVDPEDVDWQPTDFVSGMLHVLPIATPWTVDEALRGLLSERYGRVGQSPAPSWLSDLSLPPTTELDRRIAALQAELQQRGEELARAETERGEQQAAIGLLYESGAALEQLVADALSEMGVAIGAAHAQEEFTASFEGITAAVEVKGNTKSASQDDYRALADYLTQHDISGGKASRGILVVCAWRTLHPTKRQAWFPDNVAKAAKGQGRICLLRSKDLYEALIAWRAGQHEKARAFLRAVFSTSGEVGWPHVAGAG